MFDIDWVDATGVADADDHQLVTAMAGWARVEAAAAAQRLAVIAEYTRRRLDDSDVCVRWMADGWDCAAGQIAAATAITPGRASNQMYVATALRNRLPKIAALFLAGEIAADIVGTIVWHTTLVQDAAALAAIDEALAGLASRYGRLSAAKMAAAVRGVVEEHDPDAVRRSRVHANTRELVIDTDDEQTGTAKLWGRLYAHDAAALDQRLAALADTVCDGDPRTVAQRRADALGVLAVGGDALRCRCGRTDCPAAGRAAGPGRAVIYVVADPDTVATQPDAAQHGRPGDIPDRPAGPASADDAAEGGDPPDRGPEPRDAVEGSDRESRRPLPAVSGIAPAQIIGGPILPATVLAELIRAGATVKPLPIPGPEPEPHYRPSARLAAYIRARDLTCRFPGCEQPAQHCDIDHAIAYASGGPTHPANLRLLCRKHHLMKTFLNWADTQHPDGTIDWIGPAGHTHTTRPGGIVAFPQLGRPIPGPPPSPPRPADPDADPAARSHKMPLRSRTRAECRASAIAAERRRNRRERPLRECRERLRRERNYRHREPDPYAGYERATAGSDDDPPPF